MTETQQQQEPDPKPDLKRIIRLLDEAADLARKHEYTRERAPELDLQSEIFQEMLEEA